MDEIVMEFLGEAEDGLSSIDNSLLELEKDPHNAEVIGAIFRVMHSLKGTSGFLGLSKLEKVAHAGENVLNKIRDNTLEPTSEVLDAVFKCLDTIRIIVSHIRENQEEPQEEFKELLTLLDVIYKGEKVEAAHKGEVVPEMPLPPANDSTPQEEHKEVVAEAKKVTKPAEQQSEAIRVKISLLDQLMESVGELVLARNQLIQSARQGNTSEASYRNSIQRINHITSELQENILQTRMQPMSNVWSAYPRMIRDLSRELGKKIRLDMIGENTEIDRHLVEAIKDPLTHMIRNSVDHGIEVPADRAAAGKDEEGVVTLQAYNQAGNVVIIISDDGKGLSANKIRNKCIEKGLMTEDTAKTLSDQQIYQYIFAPGFSTAEKVTAVSGRGVGMDVVKTNISKIGGHIELKSKEGEGSQFIIKIPLTLAIMPVILMSIGTNKYAFPLANVYELIKINANSEYKMEYLNEAPILKIRGQVVPLIIMDELLNGYSLRHETLHKKLFVVICNVGEQTFGIVVDRIHDIEEIVVKPNSSAMSSIQVYGGCTILGDGSVIMIFDPQVLLSTVQKTTDSSVSQYNSKSILHEDAAHDDSITSQLLLIQTSEDINSEKAIPMEFINRIEELETSKIELVSGDYVIQYRESLMRLASFEEGFNFMEKEVVETVVFSNNGENFGLVVQEVIDIVDHVFDGKILKSHNPKYLSTVVINEKSTEVIDVNHFFQKNLVAPLTTDSVLLHGKATHEMAYGGGHVLLVDDSAFFRKFIPPVISSAGYTVSVVDSVEKAKEMLKASGDISAVITDLQMPGLTGTDLAEFMRANEKYKDLPIIALSAFNEEEVESKGQKLEDFDAFIPKTHQGKIVETLNKLVA